MSIYPSPILLNAGDPSKISLDQSIDIALTLAMADLKARFIDAEKGVVHYRAIRGSEEFERYKDLTKGLQSFDLRSLQERNRRLAFWINIYNTAVIHGVIELGLDKSVKEVSGFFDRVMYEIGGFRFSLNDMEHGILRGNRRHPYGLLKPFRKKDPRMEFAILLLIHESISHWSAVPDRARLLAFTKPIRLIFSSNSLPRVSSTALK